MSIMNKNQREKVYEQIHPNVFTGRDFTEWMKRHRLTKRGCSRVLGMSPITISKMMKSQAIPVKVGWACDFIDSDSGYLDLKKPLRYQNGKDLSVWRQRLGLTLDAASTLLGIYFRRYWEKEKEQNQMSRYLSMAAQHIENIWPMKGKKYLETYNQIKKLVK